MYFPREQIHEKLPSENSKGGMKITPKTVIVIKYSSNFIKDIKRTCNQDFN